MRRQKFTGGHSILHVEYIEQGRNSWKNKPLIHVNTNTCAFVNTHKNHTHIHTCMISLHTHIEGHFYKHKHTYTRVCTCADNSVVTKSHRGRIDWRASPLNCLEFHVDEIGFDIKARFINIDLEIFHDRIRPVGSWRYSTQIVARIRIGSTETDLHDIRLYFTK